LNGSKRLGNRLVIVVMVVCFLTLAYYNLRSMDINQIIMIMALLGLGLSIGYSILAGRKEYD